MKTMGDTQEVPARVIYLFMRFYIVRTLPEGVRVLYNRTSYIT